MAIKVKSMNLASLGICVITAVMAFIVIFFIAKSSLLISGFSSVVMGFIAYVASRFMIWKFVLYRIKPIYQLLFERTMSMNELASHFAGADIISNVGDDLAVWAEKKSAEIYRLKEMESYRKEFLGNVSHELKTPLFTLQGYVLTLLDGGLTDPQINVPYLEKANKNIDRLIAIVTDLEDISKLEMKVTNLNREQFDVVELAREVAESFNLRFNDNNIIIKVPSELPVDVFADKGRIEQVFNNLISNSIKYGKKNGLTTIRFIDMFDKVMVEIEDNGIGIEKELLPRVFERFFRADKSRSRDNGGTGLGLAIVKHIIEAHGEQITVRSEMGKGTTFSFILKKYL